MFRNQIKFLCNLVEDDKLNVSFLHSKEANSQNIFIDIANALFG